MSRCDSTYDPFPDGHYIHPFHELVWEYEDNGGKEHPRTVRSHAVTLETTRFDRKTTLVSDRRNADVRSLERHSGEIQLVGKDQGSRPRREMEARSFGSAKE